MQPKGAGPGPPPAAGSCERLPARGSSRLQRLFKKVLGSATHHLVDMGVQATLFSEYRLQSSWSKSSTEKGKRSCDCKTHSQSALCIQKCHLHVPATLFYKING